MLQTILNLWPEDDSFINITANINRIPDYRAAVTGMDGSARAFFMAALVYFCRRPTLIITTDAPRADKLFSDLQGFLPGQVNMLPSRELFMNTEVLSRSEEYQQMRMQFLEWLHSGKGGIYVAPAAAFISKALPPLIFKGFIINLLPGQRIDRQKLIVELVERGYERVSITETGGQFSARGDIIDIYSPGGREPFRIELFDDLVESIRHFNPLTQRSTEKLEMATILPARELLINKDFHSSGERKIKQSLDIALSKLRKRGETDISLRLKQQVSRHLERLAQPDGLDILSSYFPFFYGEGASLLDYLSPKNMVLIEEPAAVIEKGIILRRELDDYYSSVLSEGGLLAPGSDLSWKEEELLNRLPCPLIGTALFPEAGGVFKALDSFMIETKIAPYYHGQWELFKNDYRDWIKEGYRVYLSVISETRGKALQDLLAGQDLSTVKIIGDSSAETLVPLPILTSNFEGGFIVPGLKLAVITEQNFLPRRKKKKRFKQQEGVRLSDYRELALGDYVVHEQHGIGKYQGLYTLEVGGVRRDYLLLKYRGTDKLYIPVDQVGLIQKYSGGDGLAPPLHSLGGGEWQRLKKRVNRSVEELARELLALYAARKAVAGYSFGPDHPWQQEFEVLFPFEETPDQLQAVADVKADLEKNHPMDRLICGDVGYGKTEVAMRAAFKVVTEGKQVALLVPTTVLAQQHYRTFLERLEDFPVRVAQLSRFVPPAKQKELIKEIAAGKIDIVIGTHRLLSKDIRFHDLGLLVVDEEQRFGVRQKEKMKQMRLEVDTLTMTATPIPRTLHLSLAGVRDFSIIDTPPEDRYPIQTYVVEYSDKLVQEAVRRELNRQGQVYLVFNRIDRIIKYAERIQKMFPHVSIAVGHGQLPEALLARVMADFQDGRYQILISTTIIESGLDIPNVNTLIIYEADKFGLAQLYQIRGRVGRSNRLAYAYLTYRKDKLISETAKKRLRAIKEFTELGSGFKIALRDLEIRGAGNILGAEQHGFIAAVGFDLYARLLDQAVAELKNEKREEKVKPRLELRVNAYLPSAYISAQDQKVDFYQRIYSALEPDELQEIKEELSDRYGSPPDSARHLLKVAEIRVLAVKLGVELIHQQQSDVIIQFCSGNSFDYDLLKEKADFNLEHINVIKRRPLTLKITVAGKSVALLEEMTLLLQQFSVFKERSAGS
ncbi:MAG: transcription-repair coupling factor [Bacillota bacterium]